MSGRSGAAASAVHAANWSSTAKDAWFAISPATAKAPKSRKGSGRVRPFGIGAG